MSSENHRREGVRLAYHIIKDAEDLEQARTLLEARLTRTEQTNAPIAVRDSDLKRFESDVKMSVYSVMLACILSVLEKHGFNKEQMDEIAEEFAELVDTVYGGWLDFPDLLEYFKDEYDIDLKAKIEDGGERLARIEEKLNKRDDFVGGKYKSLKRGV